VMSAAWSAAAVWDMSAAALTPVLFREVFDVVSEGTAGRRVEGFAVDGRAGGTAGGRWSGMLRRAEDDIWWSC
jgi:hypothetical protein